MASSVKKMPKSERQERIRQLTVAWLEIELELIIAGKQTKADLENAFWFFCRSKGIDSPQNTDLRRRIARDATSWLKLIATAQKG